MRRVAIAAAVLLLGCTGSGEGSGQGETDADAGDDGGGDPCAPIGPEILTSRGAIVGAPSGGTCAFKGVPYAVPPVGSMRWRSPSPAPSHDGVLVADAFGSPCPQLGIEGGALGDEDCLMLNLWVPPGAGPKPVLLFFHGGGNVAGTAADPTYDGAELALRSDTIVVTFDFRIAQLGYLVHDSLAVGDPRGIAGNYGLLDQRLAVEWIHDEIEAFGGDPTRVVAFGQSAGARNLCTWLGAGQLAGLLSGAVLQSGACNPREIEAARVFGDQFARESGCASDADPAVCLRGLEPQTVLRTVPGVPGPLTTSEWNPVIDGVLLDEPPLDRIAARGAGMPVIVGTNVEEVGEVIPTVENEDEHAALLRVFFGPDRAPLVAAEYSAGGFPTPRDAVIAAVTDARYTCPLRAVARAAAGTGPTYRYLFARGVDADPAAGARHGLELVFLFRSFQAIGLDPTSADLELSEAIIEYYGRFAHTGDPNGAGAVAWPDYRVADERVLVLDVPPTIAARPRGAHCDFWDDLVTRAP